MLNLILFALLSFAPPNPDFNGDGFVNGDDQEQFTVAFQAESIAADFDGNSFVNGDDFDAYMVAYIAGISSSDYSDVTPAPGSIVWYVSTTGDDKGLGTEASPLRSAKLAVSRLRHLSSDQVQLAKGGRWVGGLGQCKAGGLSGRPVVITSYGDGSRPIVLCKDESGIEFTGGGGSPANISHVLISGIDFRAEGRSAASQNSGVCVIRAGENFSIEDCSIDGFKENILFQGPDGNPYRNVRVYRSNISHAWGVEGVSGHAQGMFVDNVDGITVDGCVLDHNGWSETVPGADATPFNHNTYMSRVTNVVIKNTITARASSHGLSANQDAVFLGNLCWRNPYHFVRNYKATVRANVFLESGDIGDAERGNGIVVGGVYHAGDHASGSTLDDNVFSGKTARGQNPAIQISAGPATATNNIVDAWPCPQGQIVLEPATLAGVVQVGNEFANAAWVRHTLDDYAHSIGLKDADEFMAAARANARSNWNVQLTANAANTYIRDGYGK